MRLEDAGKDGTYELPALWRYVMVILGEILV